VARSETFRREPFAGRFGALPTERSFFGQHARAVEGAPLGWTADDGSFVINDVQAGVLTAYKGFDSPAGVPKTAAEAADILRALDVDPTTLISDPFSFVARQSLARAAADGRVLVVGDGAGTVQPVTQAGVMLALLDAERATRTIVSSHGATPDVVERAVATYDAQTRGMHQLFLA
jgi:2-polyprenyl-6-methoxyphenol hydroxylase-like FAD-dependent oxidoreductase